MAQSWLQDGVCGLWCQLTGGDVDVELRGGIQVGRQVQSLVTAASNPAGSGGAGSGGGGGQTWPEVGISAHIRPPPPPSPPRDGPHGTTDTDRDGPGEDVANENPTEHMY